MKPMQDAVGYRIAPRGAISAQSGVALSPANLKRKRHTVGWLIRYTFFAFIFSLAFEEFDLGLASTSSRLIGLALAGFALLQPNVCYKRPPKAFWYFAIYLSIYAGFGFYLIAVPPNVPAYSSSFIGALFKQVQLLVLFWISYNLVTNERVAVGAVWSLTAATILLAGLQLAGISSDTAEQGRVSAFGSNPNSLATILSLGLIGLFGLSYGRENDNWKARALFWLSSGVLALQIVQTGSRGGVLALLATLCFLYLRGTSLATKLKLGAIALTGGVLLIVSSYHIDAVRVRWEKAIYDESLAGREYIFPATISMIIERPLTGWGPVNHLWELGPRVGREFRDHHNIYLYILAEVGLLGAIPFFAGLFLCGRAAWRSRHKIQGVLPLMMVLFILASGLKGSLHNRKYFWVVLSLALATNSYRDWSQRSRTTVRPRYPGDTRPLGQRAYPASIPRQHGLWNRSVSDPKRRINRKR